MEIWDEIADGRRRLAALLREIDSGEWTAPSLCGEWLVRDVVAHLVAPLVTSTPRALGMFVLARFDLDRLNVRMARDVGRRPNEELITTLEANAQHRFTPPGYGPEAPLADITLHTLDIRWPLHRRADIPEPTARHVLDTLGNGVVKELGPASGRAGLRFVASDLDWSCGSGAEVLGPAQALMLAFTGRAAGLDELDGDGVPMLRDRLVTG